MKVSPIQPINCSTLQKAKSYPCLTFCATAPKHKFKLSEDTKSLLLFLTFPVITATAVLLNNNQDGKLDRMFEKKREIAAKVGEIAGKKPMSITYLSGLIFSAIEKEPIFFKEKYWNEQIPLLAQKAIKQFADVDAGIRNRVRQAQKAEYEHKMYIKNLINNDEELQNYFKNSKVAENKLKKQYPNKNRFKTYTLSYTECSGFSSGIISQIKQLPLEKNAKKVEIGTKTITRNVPSGVQTRFGVDLLKTESKNIPVYKTVYPNNIISFAHNNEELNQIEIHCYKK